jgi:hypothetical protein
VAHDVFICHSAQDRIVANAACAHLEAHGIRCWIAPRDPIPGIPYGRQLVDAIAQTRLVVLIFSAHANASEAVLSELELAYKRGKNIIPFRIELVLPEGDLEYYIQRVHWLDAMNPPMEKRLDELVELVRRVLDAAPSRASAAPAPDVAASERALIEGAPEPNPAVTPDVHDAPPDPNRRLTVSAIAAPPVTANASMAFSYRVVGDGSEKEQVDFVDSHGTMRPAVVRNRQRAGDEVSGEVSVPSDAKPGEAMRLRVATWDAAGNPVWGLGPSFVVEAAAKPAPPQVAPKPSPFVVGWVLAAVLVLFAGVFALMHRPGPAVVAVATPRPFVIPTHRPTPRREFRSPTGGIGCEFYNNSLRCDVIGGVVPLPPQPKNCPFDWGQGFYLGPHGTASIVCAGDTALNHSTNVVRYGTTWRGGSFACSSSTNGLRCTNADRHGFLISRGEAYRF